MEQKSNETEILQPSPIEVPQEVSETDQTANDILLKVILDQQLQIKRGLSELKTEVEKGFKKMRAECDAIKSGIQSFSIARADELRPIQPAFIPTQLIPNLPITLEKPANLMKKPKNLFVLWREYVTGIDGNKPAKDFTSSERGRLKSNYSRRKRFWGLVEKYNKKGVKAEVVIEKLYQHYGRFTPTTTILDNLRKDRAVIDTVLNIINIE